MPMIFVKWNFSIHVHFSCSDFILLLYNIQINQNPFRVIFNILLLFMIYFKYENSGFIFKFDRYTIITTIDSKFWENCNWKETILFFSKKRSEDSFRRIKGNAKLQERQNCFSNLRIFHFQIGFLPRRLVLARPRRAVISSAWSPDLPPRLRWSVTDGWKFFFFSYPLCTARGERGRSRSRNSVAARNTTDWCTYFEASYLGNRLRHRVEGKMDHREHGFLFDDTVNTALMY